MVNKWNLYEVAVAFSSQASLYHLLLEGVLVLWLLWLLLRKSYNPREQAGLTEQEKEELISEWTPEPLVPESPQDHRALNPYVIDGRIGKYIEVNGKRCLNIGTHNYLGLLENPTIEEAARKSIQKYGVGSCGPRGFYGTVDVHLNLEQQLARFMSMEEAVLYSYNFSTVASAIPAYSKRGDVIFVDDGVNFAIQQGLTASRSRIKFFRHNDVSHLEELLEEQDKDDKRNPKKARVTRRFLVVEGVYLDHGDLCPLPQLVELKKKFKLRLFIDESVSFLSLGATGRGITQYYGLSVDDIDLMCGSLEHAVGSIGGFCAGTCYVVDHQRLSGLGYCFSASLPPLLATAATIALEEVQKNPSIFDDLRNCCNLLHSALCELPILKLHGHPDSPVKVLRLRKPTGDIEADRETLWHIVEMARQQGLAVAVASSLKSNCLPDVQPSIRVNASSVLNKQDIQMIEDTLSSVCKMVVESRTIVNSK